MRAASGKALFARDACLNALEQGVEGFDEGSGFLQFGAADGGKIGSGAVGRFVGEDGQGVSGCG
ncbi:hypothetical protein BG910_05930 [Neisseria chenwenguii]|uniref:Uncharacterized protein n=1 Tax=Neisseria chenwenguii TaxID=1853278 RepID=A0A220S1V4_9NEIS|nr:hypothetical protein BG910_05930 [Neisseria chenwenguii]